MPILIFFCKFHLFIIILHEYFSIKFAFRFSKKMESKIRVASVFATEEEIKEQYSDKLLLSDYESSTFSGLKFKMKDHNFAPMALENASMSYALEKSDQLFELIPANSYNLLIENGKVVGDEKFDKIFPEGIKLILKKYHKMCLIYISNIVALQDMIKNGQTIYGIQEKYDFGARTCFLMEKSHLFNCDFPDITAFCNENHLAGPLKHVFGTMFSSASNFNEFCIAKEPNSQFFPDYWKHNMGNSDFYHKELGCYNLKLRAQKVAQRKNCVFVFEGTSGCRKTTEINVIHNRLLHEIHEAEDPNKLLWKKVIVKKFDYETLLRNAFVHDVEFGRSFEKKHMNSLTEDVYNNILNMAFENLLHELEESNAENTLVLVDRCSLSNGLYRIKQTKFKGIPKLNSEEIDQLYHYGKSAIFTLEGALMASGLMKLLIVTCADIYSLSESVKRRGCLSDKTNSDSIGYMVMQNVSFATMASGMQEVLPKESISHLHIGKLRNISEFLHFDANGFHYKNEIEISENYDKFDAVTPRCVATKKSPKGDYILPIPPCVMDPTYVKIYLIKDPKSNVVDRIKDQNVILKSIIKKLENIEDSEDFVGDVDGSSAKGRGIFEGDGSAKSENSVGFGPTNVKNSRNVMHETKQHTKGKVYQQVEELKHRPIEQRKLIAVSPQTQKIKQKANKFEEYKHSKLKTDDEKFDSFTKSERAEVDKRPCLLRSYSISNQEE